MLDSITNIHCLTALIFDWNVQWHGMMTTAWNNMVTKIHIDLKWNIESFVPLLTYIRLLMLLLYC